MHRPERLYSVNNKRVGVHGGIPLYTDVIKGLVFDMDGLLFDSERVVQQSWNYAGNLLGFGNLGEHIYHTIGMNRGGREIYFREHVDADFPMERFNEVTRARYYEILEQTGIPMKPGAKELLWAAKEKGLRIALATSSSRDHAEAMLARYDLAQFFDGCVCGDMVTRSKPDPEIYEKACRLIDVPSQYAVALEDAPSGVRSAAAAGMRVIVVPDLVAPSEEILALAWKRCDSLTDVIGMI